MQPQKITLYSKTDCRLCADIRAFLQARIPKNVQIKEIDITTNSELLNEFWQKIPVLKSKTGEFLFFPFTNEEFAEFIACYS